MKDLLNIGKSGVLAANRAINTTSHNIANANTEGYSRQRVDMVPLDYRKNGFSLGIGVNADRIVRLRNEIIDQQIQEKSSQISYFNEQATIYRQLEGILATGSGGDLDSLVYDFFESFDKLAQKPEELSSRENVLYKATNLVEKLKKLNTELEQVKESTVAVAREQTQSISGLLSDIASLNLDIIRGGAQGKPDNNALDVQNQKMRELSDVIEFTSDRQENGDVEIRIGGVIVVSGTKAESIKPEVDLANNVFRFRLSNGVALETANGILGARVEMFQDIIPGIQQNLNTFTKTLVSSVNDIHRTGYGLNNTTGNNFFDPNGQKMSDIAINQALFTNPSNIAASSAANSPGNNTVAVRLANLTNTAVLSGRTFGEYALSLSSDVGSKVNSIETNLSALDASRRLLENEQESIAGVNIDEELANLIKFQNAYQASARVLSTAQDMFDSILAIV